MKKKTRGKAGAPPPTRKTDTGASVLVERRTGGERSEGEDAVLGMYIVYSDRGPA